MAWYALYKWYKDWSRIGYPNMIRWYSGKLNPPKFTILEFSGGNNMKIKEAKNILELIRDHIETPIPEITRTGLAITALTGGIDALESAEALKNRFIDGMNVHSQGDDADDAIECPFCGYEVARNDDYEEMRPKHCPKCGTKLIY